jgi:hypothetical protein
MNAKDKIEMIEKAIDAIIDLEGTPIYPNGLPGQFREVLSLLRSKRNLLMDDADQADHETVLHKAVLAVAH